MRLPVVNLGRLGTVERAPLPKPDGALYRHPNPDGSRKACRNCIMWVSEEDRCVIHARGQEVDASQVCGYHIFGQPMVKWMDHPGIQPVTPDISGLRNAGGGVACGSCRFFQHTGGAGGLCFGVSRPGDRQPPQPVELQGWCARYESI